MSANFKKHNRLQIATAFSGGLAAVEFALRYESINHEIIFACEFDKYARQQYLKFHGKPKTFYKDIRDLKAVKYLGHIDLFVWGSPCQDLSLAGKRKGFNGEKSSLFREGARVQEEMKPKVFIFENVKGLLSSNRGADYEEVCDTFRNQGYHIVTLQMNTKDYGVPQNRERIFIVGFLDVNKYHSYVEPKPFKLELKLKDILEINVSEKYYLSDKMIKGFISGNSVFKERFKVIEADKQDYAYCLDCRCGGGRRTSNFIKVPSATKIGYEIANIGDSINLTHLNSSTRRGRVGKQVAQTLDCACNQAVMEQYRIRKLTSIECFRLQGVRNEDINLVVSDTQAYKIAGNAISVNVMQYLLKSIFEKSEIKTSIFDFINTNL